MKTINNFIVEHLEYSTFPINEKLKISSKSDINVYTCHPKDKYELRKILGERLIKNKNANLNDIDVSQITDMGPNELLNNYGLFEGLDPHNIDISLWNVSNVKNMSGLFINCTNFAGKGLENWDVSNVTNMLGMFYFCKNFTGEGLENWDVSSVTNMQAMFMFCRKLNCDLSNWDVSNVKKMMSTFYGCSSLKNIPSWWKE